MTRLERRKAPLGLAVLGWMLLVWGSVFTLGSSAVLLYWFDPGEGDSVLQTLPFVLWCASFPLLGLACLRGWKLISWLWLAAHGLMLFSIAWTSLARPLGEGSWFFLAFLAPIYALVAGVLFSRRARAFFRSPAVTLA